jgi:hypothetical protein
MNSIFGSFGVTDNTRILINEPYEKLNRLFREYKFIVQLLSWVFSIGPLIP